MTEESRTPCRQSLVVQVGDELVFPSEGSTPDKPNGGEVLTTQLPCGQGLIAVHHRFRPDIYPTWVPTSSLLFA